MDQIPADGGYSASVSLTLRINGCRFPAAQIGRDRVVLREAVALPAGPAEMIAVIDGHEHRWPIRIQDREQAREVVPIEIELETPA